MPRATFVTEGVTVIPHFRPVRARLLTALAVAPLALVLSAASTPAAAQGAAGIDGLWDATIATANTTIPFRFEIATKGSDAQGFFFEGDRKVESSSGTFTGGVLTLTWDHLNTTMTLKRAAGALTGAYVNNRPNSKPQAVEMRRFAPTSADAADAPQIAGSWEMRRVAEEVSAPRDTRTWHLFLRQSGAEVSGSILRIDGDTGTLVGSWKGSALTLSHFAGERPNLLEAKRNADGTLSATLNGNAHYLVVRSGDARAKGIPEPPDPSRYTSVKDPTSPFQFAFPDLAGATVSNSDPVFKGKVVILSIGGSWCPNCHDEAPFLNELNKTYRARGLEIVGLMFENDENPDVARPRVRAFMKRFGISYQMLIAGTTQNIGEKLPQIVNFGAYPTTIFLGRDGKVRSVHAGFASPATGEEHTRLKTEVRGLVERLLAESASGSAADRDR
jgi:thiol-disulfide isomerase/thioredoxin